MNVERWRRKIFLVLILGAGVLVSSESLLAAERADPPDLYKGLREATLKYVALGAPDDLLRLREAFDKSEREIARLKLDIPSEGQEVIAKKQKILKDLKDRLEESEVSLRLLGDSCGKIGKKQLDPAKAGDHDLLLKANCRRIDSLKKEVGDLEKETRSDQTLYLRALEEERAALGKIIEVRREWLISEYQNLSDCAADNRSCLARKLKILCRLTPLFPSGSRALLLITIQEVGSRLDVGSGLTSVCDYLRHDFEQ